MFRNSIHNNKNKIYNNGSAEKNARLKSRVIGILTAALAAVLTMGAPLAVSADEYNDGSTYMGIDVSQWNGDIDWNAVASDGYTFAFIRGGAEYDYTDTKFHENMEGAAAAGIARGVYYYSLATDEARAIADADFLINLVQGYDVELPLVIDLEDDCQLGLSREELTAIAAAFCNEISAYGYTPMVYVSESWALNNIDLDALEGVPRWIAAWSMYTDSTQRHIWQCSNVGVVSGITGDVDIDISFVNPLSLTGSTAYVSLSGYSAGWYEDSDGDWYLYGDEGSVLTGWQKSGGSWYYLYDDGTMATGWVEIGGTWYYLKENGTMATGWLETDSGWHLFDDDGKMQSGWVSENGSWYYLKDGTAVTGWLEIDSVWYYFDAASVMVTGNQEIDGEYYYFSENGVLQDLQE